MVENKSIQKRTKPQVIGSVFLRIKTICYKHRLPLLTTEERREVGGIVKDMFFLETTNKKGLYWYKTLQKEPEGDFMVLCYPLRFIPVIDSIIYEYLRRKIKQEQECLKSGTYQLQSL